MNLLCFLDNYIFAFVLYVEWIKDKKMKFKAAQHKIIKNKQEKRDREEK